MSEVKSVSASSLAILEQYPIADYSDPYCFAKVPFDTAIIDTVNSVYAEKNGEAVQHVFLVGIGGSHLGAQAIYDAVSRLPYEPDRVNFYPVTALDPYALAQQKKLLEDLRCAGERIIVIIVSKSGSTLETAAHASLFSAYRESLIVVTDQDSLLFYQCQQENITTIVIPSQLGGRYSIFSAAGLTVLRFLGLDIRDLLAGAQSAQPADALTSAHALYGAFVDGILVYDIFTFMPRYAALAGWYRQLIGESLGKQGKGFLPTVSTAQDLHSVIQQYFGGKQISFTQFFTPVSVSTDSIPVTFFSKTAQLPEHLTFSQAQRAIIDGVLAAYTQAGKPFLVHEFTQGSLFDLGYFMQLKMFETVFLATLMGVDPFDQPEVELYKQQTKKILKDLV